MNWTNVKLIFLRELRDQLRDRRTLFTIVVLPLLLYPLMGMSVFQVQQFLKEHESKVWIVGAQALPSEPAFLEDGKIAAPEWLPEREANLITLELKTVEEVGGDGLRERTERAIRAGKCDAVVLFPDDFADRLASGDAVDPEVLRSTASDKSKVAASRLNRALEAWTRAVKDKNLEKVESKPAIPHIEIKQTDVAEPARRRAALWSKILPFILMVWALTGAFYPAVDLCAGEKERGTLETLLSSPAARGEIVWGKLLTVMTFSIATSLLNLGSMCVTGTFIVSQIQKMGSAPMPIEIGPPPVAAMAWLVLALVPISALFSALSLAIAAFARSTKEGQYYLLPLLMISLPLMMLPMLPTTELDLGFSLIPLSGLMLLLRSLMEGQYYDALRFSLPVIVVTGICCHFAIRWAIDQFNNESVLFRENERFGLGLWMRHLVRDRQDTPTAGEAILCGVLLLVIRFFFGLVAPAQDTWPEMATTTTIMLIALIAGPACLMAVMLTRRPAQTLLLGRPSFAATLPAAALLALLLHPTMLWINEAIRWLYPINPQAIEKISELNEMITAAPLAQVLFVIAIVPAICEELAFRGFILSGLRHMGHKWGAILITSVFFGMAHGILQQSLAAGAVGIVIGYLAVKTGSLWPGVLYHGVHNAMSVLLGRLPADWVDASPLMKLLFFRGAEPGQVGYALPATVAAALLAAAILWWFKSLPYRRSDEERLQEALDQSPARLAAPPAV